MEGLVREAAMLVLSKNNMKPAPIEMKHFKEILDKISPSIDENPKTLITSLKKTYLILGQLCWVIIFN